MTARIKVLYEDNHLLVIVKPAGIATQGTRDEPSVVTWARDYLKDKYQKPGNVYVGVVSRLDKPVSGVLVLARTSKAAARLSEQFRQSTVKKFYLAVVQGCPSPDQEQHRGHRRDSQASSDPTWHECCDWVCKSERWQRMVIVSRKSSQAVQARLRWQCLRTQGAHSLLRIELLTGRKHQIRLQLAHLGCPIVGDLKYGEPTAAGKLQTKPSKRSPAGQRSRDAHHQRSHRQDPNRIALHAERLIFQHPVRDETLEFSAPTPSWWNSFGVLR